MRAKHSLKESTRYRKMTRSDFFFFLILLVSFHIFSLGLHGKQQPTKDTTSLKRIEVPSDAFDKYLENKDFKYKPVQASPNFLERLLLWLSQWFGFQYLMGAAPWIMYTLLLIAFLILVVVLFRGRLQSIFFVNRVDKGIPIHDSEISDTIDFDALLKRAYADKNYNLAVRYFYLILLRLLNQKNLITYKLGKTNFEYLNELKNEDILPYFKRATHNYEYAWYGQFHLEENSYQNIADEFRSLINRLNG